MPPCDQIEQLIFQNCSGELFARCFFLIEHLYLSVFACTNTAVASIQRLPAVSVMTDINFPMKGRKGMVDWARNSEDKVVIPKGLFVSQSAGISLNMSTASHEHIPSCSVQEPKLHKLSLCVSLTSWLRVYFSDFRVNSKWKVHLKRKCDEGTSFHWMFCHWLDRRCLQK